jgi:hypothetical protein
LFTLGSFLKITQETKLFGYFFSAKLIVTKMGWATFWAIFFTNSSGHPAEEKVADLVDFPSIQKPGIFYGKIVTV